MSWWAHICTHAHHSSLSQLTLEMLIPDLTQFLWKLSKGGSEVITCNLLILTYINVPFLQYIYYWVTLLHKQTSVYFKCLSLCSQSTLVPYLFIFIMYLHSSTLRNWLISDTFYFDFDGFAQVSSWHLPK